MTRRLTIVLDESVTKAECRECSYAIEEKSRLWRCLVHDRRLSALWTGELERLPECLEAERAAARMVDPTEALLHLADVSERLDLDAMDDQESNWRALHVAAAIEALTGGTDTPTTRRARR